MSELNYIVRDIQRRLSNMVKRGRVHSVDFSKTPPRVRVEYAENAVTGWLPWVSGLASVKGRTDWNPLSIGEQVLIVSESGDLSSGVVIGSLLDSTNTPPSHSEFEHMTQFDDGTSFSYNRKTHELKVDIKGALSLSTSGKLDISVEGDAYISSLGAVSVESKDSLSINSGGDIDIEAEGNLSLKGTRIDLN
ncbi:phage baseplate assembly protein V [Vibrio olivae]|uniref:Phage baseplate assembly protein V n=1 Tax=Vibrio olivae TaxID=1243002 RepID=A0ABV5HRB1_9VIBR